MMVVFCHDFYVASHNNLRAAAVIITCLNWRAGHATVRAKHATIARLRLEQRMAVGAFIKPLAGIGGHGQHFGMSAGRTSQQRVQLYVHV